MPLDREAARKFLRGEFGLDVAEDDPILAPYLLAQFGLDHLKPHFEEAARLSATAVAEGAVSALVQEREATLDALETAKTGTIRSIAESYAVLDDTAKRLAGLKDAMIATLHAAEDLKRLHEETDAKTRALTETADRIEANAIRLEKAVVAAAAGANIKRGFFG